MIQYIRNILGTYTPLSGEGIASLDIEYIVGAILLIIGVVYVLRFMYTIIKMVFE